MKKRRILSIFGELFKLVVHLLLGSGGKVHKHYTYIGGNLNEQS